MTLYAQKRTQKKFKIKNFADFCFQDQVITSSYEHFVPTSI